MTQPSSVIITVGLVAGSAPTVSPSTATVTPQGNQGITWTVGTAPPGWTISSITINANGNNAWPGGTPTALGDGFTWTVSDMVGNPNSLLFTYTIWMSDGTSTTSVDPEILNSPPGNW